MGGIVASAIQYVSLFHSWQQFDLWDCFRPSVFVQAQTSKEDLKTWLNYSLMMFQDNYILMISIVQPLYIYILWVYICLIYAQHCLTSLSGDIRLWRIQGASRHHSQRPATQQVAENAVGRMNIYLVGSYQCYIYSYIYTHIVHIRCIYIQYILCCYCVRLYLRFYTKMPKTNFHVWEFKSGPRLT